MLFQERLTQVVVAVVANLLLVVTPLVLVVLVL
jgi:hypothetical protein